MPKIIPDCFSVNSISSFNIILTENWTMKKLQIRTLDHVAIHVNDLERSAAWYHRVLGLERVQPREWGPFPAFMVAEDGTGVALFPSQNKSPGRLPEGTVIRAGHYAFRVDPDNFEQAKEQLNTEGVEFEFQDHHYFHSIYFFDPDGHRLEITTQVKVMNRDDSPSER
jgi:catechol 2,3-dioxygenase-like lactoylglutathione lyase family enzyme